MFAALPLLLIAALAPQPGCGPRTVAVLAEINLARLNAGTAALRSHRALCGAAAERAREIAVDGATQRRIEDVNRRTRSLYRLGYAAHAWSEASLIGGGDDPWLEQFREVRVGWLEEAVRGDFEEVGIGVDEWDGRPVVAVLLALPRRSVEWREAAPLADLASVRSQVLATVNRIRARRRLPLLETQPQLDSVAQSHAEDMLRRRYYDHRTPEGASPRERVRDAGYRKASRIAENIAKGLFTPTEVVERWMNSSGHRRNILEPTTREMGVGVAYGDTAKGLEILWVQLFAGG